MTSLWQQRARGQGFALPSPDSMFTSGCGDRWYMALRDGQIIVWGTDVTTIATIDMKHVQDRLPDAPYVLQATEAMWLIACIQSARERAA